MIAKITRSKDGIGAGGTDFAGAVAYITRADKASHCFYGGVSSIEYAAEQMQDLAACNRRMKKPVLHIAVSVRAGEAMSEANAETIAAGIISALKADGHQYVCAIHADTKNIHVHIVLNKVHPRTMKCCNLQHSYAKVEKACRELEAALGYAVDNGRYEALVHASGEVELYPKSVSAHEKKVSSRTAKRERGEEISIQKFRSGKNLHKRLNESGEIAALKDALSGPNWSAIHRQVQYLGLDLHCHGSGLRISSTTDKDEYLSPSHIDKRFSLNALVGRLGPFVPASPDQSTSSVASKVPSSDAAMISQLVDAGKRRAKRNRRRKGERRDRLIESLVCTAHIERAAIEARHQTILSGLVREFDRGTLDDDLVVMRQLAAQTRWYLKDIDDFDRGLRAAKASIGRGRTYAPDLRTMLRRQARGDQSIDPTIGAWARSYLAQHTYDSRSHDVIEAQNIPPDRISLTSGRRKMLERRWKQGADAARPSAPDLGAILKARKQKERSSR